MLSATAQKESGPLLTEACLRLLYAGAGMSVQQIIESTGWLQADVDRAILDSDLQSTRKQLYGKILQAVASFYKVDVDQHQAALATRTAEAQKFCQKLLLQLPPASWARLAKLDDFDLAMLIANPARVIDPQSNR